MLSPPRLPALCIVFHASACYGLGRARHGLNEAKRCMFLHADPCTLCMHCSQQAARQKKASERQRVNTKKPLVVQRLYGINEPGGMQNHNGPASGVLLLVPVMVPVFFPAVAVR